MTEITPKIFSSLYRAELAGSDLWNQHPDAYYTAKTDADIRWADIAKDSAIRVIHDRLGLRYREEYPFRRCKLNLQPNEQYFRDCKLDVAGLPDFDSYPRIAIEIENADDWHQQRQELCKLSRVACDLRVLIVYQAAGARRPEDSLRQYIANYHTQMTDGNHQWLFILGPHYPNAKLRRNDAWRTYTLDASGQLVLIDEAPIYPSLEMEQTV